MHWSKLAFFTKVQEFIINYGWWKCLIFVMKKSVRSSTSSLTTYVQATPVPGDSLIMPCAHEEEDVRMLLHICHAAKQGVTKAMIRTVNTDVPVIAIGKCESLGLNELWMAYHQPQKMLSHSCLCLNVSSFCCMTERVKRIV